MRVILVPTADRPECVFALDTAFRIARKLAADVSGCHVRGQRHEARGERTQLLLEDASAEEAEGAQANLDSGGARELFERSADQHEFRIAKRSKMGVRSIAIWHEMVGTPARVFSIIGPVADLIVTSRPKAKSAGRARAFLLAALLHSARPVLVVPQKRLSTVAERIVIAWNQSREAAIAVAAAIPLLQKAERVVVVSSGPENQAGPKSSYLCQYLAHWDVKAERLAMPGRNVEKELEEACRRSDADLLVMGAYSRQRFRELIFGGVSEHMLFKSQIPVLLLHR